MILPLDWQKDPSIFLRYTGGTTMPVVVKYTGSLTSSVSYNDFFRTIPTPVTDFSFLAQPWSLTDFNNLKTEILRRDYMVNINGVVYRQVPPQNKPNGEPVAPTGSVQYIKEPDLDMSRFGFPKPPPPPPLVVREPWMNYLSPNGNWVSIDGLPRQDWLGLNDVGIVIRRSTQYIFDDGTTNVMGSFFSRIHYGNNNTPYPQHMVAPDELNPNPHLARFDKTRWAVVYHHGRLLIGTYP